MSLSSVGVLLLCLLFLLLSSTAPVFFGFSSLLLFPQLLLRLPAYCWIFFWRLPRLHSRSRPFRVLFFFFFPPPVFSVFPASSAFSLVFLLLPCRLFSRLLVLFCFSLASFLCSFSSSSYSRFFFFFFLPVGASSRYSIELVFSRVISENQWRCWKLGRKWNHLKIKTLSALPNCYIEIFQLILLLGRTQHMCQLW